MSQEQTNGLSQLQKLQALQAQNKAQAKTSSMVKLENIVGIYLGTEPIEHFPKMLDSNGNKVQEEKNGRKVDKRSETSDGWTYTFAEFSTCKTIKIVLSNIKNHNNMVFPLVSNLLFENLLPLFPTECPHSWQGRLHRYLIIHLILHKITQQ